MPRAFSWRCRVMHVDSIILAMWAATAVGISLNMTSPDPLPAGGTVIVAWARDNGTITPNPSQFGLYIYPDAGDNLVVSQIVNAGSQPSGTVTMVIPPETSPDSYDIYAFQGPDTNIPPAMWGWGFSLAATVQSASATRPASTAVTPSSSSPTPSDDPQTLSDLSHRSQTHSSSATTSNRGSQTLSDNPQSLSGASHNTNPDTSAGAATGGPSSTAISPYPFGKRTQLSVHSAQKLLSSQLSPGMISEREHRERVERLEREVQLLRQQQQQNTTFSDEPPPEYNTL
ncbi:hypothetical protein B0H14DRAFT_2871664 [Mycena olivaceomarginata]|nr:hypothetical protein B0H14DRAFT_2871664 [Mycena olivaceomarginata]